MRKLTKDEVRSWKPCWDRDGPERLDSFFAPFPDGLTPIELRDVLTAEDWLWVVLRPEVIPEHELHLLACQYAESALLRARAFSREPDPRSWVVIRVKRAWCCGEVSDAELAAARTAAWAVVDAAYAAGDMDAAAWAAANSACVGAGSAWATAWYAARASVDDAEDVLRAQQCEQAMDVFRRARG